MLSDFTGAEKVYIACGYTDLRKGIDGLATMVQSPIPARPVYQYAVPVLREAERPDQSAVLGRQRLCAAVQTVGEREFPVAAKRRRGAEADGAAIPLADGRVANRPAEGAQNPAQDEYDLEGRKVAETRENTGFFRGFCAILYTWKRQENSPKKARKW